MTPTLRSKHHTFKTTCPNWSGRRILPNGLYLSIGQQSGWPNTPFPFISIVTRGRNSAHLRKRTSNCFLLDVERKWSEQCCISTLDIYHQQAIYRLGSVKWAARSWQMWRANRHYFQHGSFWSSRVGLRLVQFLDLNNKKHTPRSFPIADIPRDLIFVNMENAKQVRRLLAEATDMSHVFTQ